MALETLVNSVFGNRVTFGTNLELQDGNLVIEDQLFPNRVGLIGACSNQEPDPDDATEYLIPTNEPVAIARLEDLQFIRNADPDKTPSEILLSFRDVYEGGGRTFEVVITGRTVAQLGDDVDASDTTIPVSTIYTGKVARMLNIGAHMTLNSHAAAFDHNDMMIVAGGERPNTPATGLITCVALASMAAGDYIIFTHSVTGATVAFWFDTTGADAEPAGAAAADNSIKVDISGDVSADDVADTLAAAIQANDDLLPITAYDGTGAGEIDLESDEAGTAGNLWTLAEFVANVGFLVTTPAGGSTTSSISRRLVKYDPSADDWSNVTNAAGIARRLLVAVRSAGAVRHNTTIVHIAGGVSTLVGAATDTCETDVQVLTFVGAGDEDISSIAAGTALATALGEAAWVKVANGTYVVFGGNTAVGAAAVPVDTIWTVTTTAIAAPLVDSTEDLDVATRWMGGYYYAGADEIYVAGGVAAGGAQDKTYIWDVSGAALVTATTAGRMTEKKYAFAIHEINGAAYVFGGSLASGDTTKIDRFDPDTLTWSVRDALGSADAGGALVKIGDRLYYADQLQGGKYNVGIGNLDDSFVGFPAASTLPATPFYIQVEWEIMQVTGYTTVRARNRDTDAFIVVRGQRTSTAIAHDGRPDVTLDPNALYSELSNAFEVMISQSVADFLAMPWRATADCPYLAEDKSFAFLAGFYAAFKSTSERIVLASLGVHPPNQNPRLAYTRSEETTWTTTLKNFSRTNYNSQNVAAILDGATDDDGDGKPDTYALWFVKDGTIPTGSPPMESGAVERDSNDKPIDLGKHLVVIAAYGFATSREYTEKWPSATRGVMRSGHGAYIGMLSTLDETLGSTGARTRGFTPLRPVALDVENDLVAARYIVPTLRSNGWRWTNGVTFAYNVSRTSRSDWVFASSVRRAAALTRAVRFILDTYIGKGLDKQTQTAMDVDISQKIQNFVAGGIVGPKTTHTVTVSDEDVILGQAKVKLSIHILGELTNIDMVAALTI